jgi:hypothetical protein
LPTQPPHHVGLSGDATDHHGLHRGDRVVDQMEQDGAADGRERESSNARYCRRREHGCGDLHKLEPRVKLGEEQTISEYGEEGSAPDKPVIRQDAHGFRDVQKALSNANSVARQTY